MRYRFVAAERATFPVRMLCRIVGVAVSGLTLVSYPELYGLPDSNSYGLKVYAFLRLCRLGFRHEHVFDATAAPRGQLPCIVDDGEAIGDGDEVVDHPAAKYHLAIDADLTPAQRTLDHLLRRMPDDLYWIMSHSRWHDPRSGRPSATRSSRRTPRRRRRTSRRPRRTTASGTTTRASAATSPRACTSAASPISPPWPAYSAPALSCSATGLTAPTPGATASWPTSTSTRSIPRSDGSASRTPSSAAIAKRCKPPWPTLPTTAEE